VTFLPGVSFGIEDSLLAPGTHLCSFVVSAFLNPICFFSFVSNGVIGLQIKESGMNVLKSEVFLSLEVINDVIR